MKIMAIDPSGNHKEGSGTTGIAVFENEHLQDVFTLKSSSYECKEEYWMNIGAKIIISKPDIVVCESYRLFSHKAKQQSWSELETPQLIGYLRVICWLNKIALIFQDPVIKNRFNDNVLQKMGIIEKKGGKYYFYGLLTNIHMRDAIRHGLYYLRYGREKVESLS